MLKPIPQDIAFLLLDQITQCNNLQGIDDNYLLIWDEVSQTLISPPKFFEAVD